MLAVGCARDVPDVFVLTREQVRALDPETTAGITYEETDGAIFVTVIDRYGDGHLHRFILGDLTRAEALDLLARKQAEFGHDP